MQSRILLFSCILAVAYATKPYLGFRIPASRTGISSRVVGGINAKKGEFPHQVSLQWGLPPVFLSHMCGGSILNERWILTAAHCPKGVPFGNIFVKAGKYQIKGKEQTEQTIEVQKSFVHPDYPGNVAPYDIALLKLKSPLKFNDMVKPIALPKANSIPEGKSILSGWGSTSSGRLPVMPNTLQKVELPLLDLDTCKTAMEKLTGPSPLHATNVCTGPLTGGLSACSGDSGGPLIRMTENGTPEVIGVVSWGVMPCGTVGAPSVYTRVSAHNEWIAQVMSSNS